MERRGQGWRRSFALHRVDPVLGDARLRHHGVAQLLDVRGQGRPAEIVQPRGAGARHVAEIPGLAWSQCGAADVASQVIPVRAEPVEARLRLTPLDKLRANGEGSRWPLTKAEPSYQSGSPS